MQDANVLEKNFTVEQEQVPPERCGVKSNISVSLAEAMLATSAVPMKYKPIKMNIEGEQLDFADGGLYYESPVAIAISEARRLCPNRPIGVIMSLGLSAKEDDYTRRAIDIARQSQGNRIPTYTFIESSLMKLWTRFTILKLIPIKLLHLRKN